MWPKLLKSLKPLLGGYKATVVLDGQVVLEEGETAGEATTTTEDRLVYKAQVATDLLDQVKEVTAVYDREEKEKLLRKTEKWLKEYQALTEQERTPALQQRQTAVAQARQTVTNILVKDNKITQHTDKIFEAAEKYLEIENQESPAATQLADKIVTALNKVFPMIKEVKDMELLEVCQDIQESLI